jgi:hypothetical protein
MKSLDHHSILQGMVSKLCITVHGLVAWIEEVAQLIISGLGDYGQSAKILYIAVIDHDHMATIDPVTVRHCQNPLIPVSYGIEVV